MAITTITTLMMMIDSNNEKNSEKFPVKDLIIIIIKIKFLLDFFLEKNGFFFHSVTISCFFHLDVNNDDDDLVVSSSLSSS